MTDTLVNIANQVACGGADSPNTGKLGCLSLFGTPTHLLAIQKGYTFGGDFVFSIENLKPLIQKGIIVPLIGASSFEDVSAEDTYSTNARGVKRLNLKGLPEYRLIFEEGHEFYRQLAKLEGYKNYDFIIGDDEGNWMVATTNDGGYKGFDAGHTTPELTSRKVPGGDAEMKAFVVQFLNRMQFDRYYAIIHAEYLDFYPEEIPAVNGVNIKFLALPGSGDSSLDVSVLLAQDNHTHVGGLEAGDFLLMVNGSSVTIDTVTEDLVTPGKYDLAFTPTLSTNDVVKLSLWDSGLNVDVLDQDGVLFRSNELSTTVA